jgi:hypothetical protein
MFLLSAHPRQILCLMLLPDCSKPEKDSQYHAISRHEF